MIRVGILTVSTSGARGEREDTSGPAIREIVVDWLGAEVAEAAIVPDELHAIKAVLVRWADLDHLDLILTTGGTGFAPQDITPEATRPLLDRETPGLAEAMRIEGRKKTPYAMLSREVAGIRGRTLIVNLPGSEKAVRESLAVIMPVLPHGLELLREEPGASERHDASKVEESIREIAD